MATIRFKIFLLKFTKTFWILTTITGLYTLFNILILRNLEVLNNQILFSSMLFLVPNLWFYRFITKGQ